MQKVGELFTIAELQQRRGVIQAAVAGKAVLHSQTLLHFLCYPPLLLSSLSHSLFLR